MLTYTGKTENTDGNNFDDHPFFPDSKTVEAVNRVILLQKPLLISGEPGCGKTALGKAVANELELPYFSWYVSSASQVNEGLYFYDATRRLQDAQMAIKPVDHEHYIRLGPIGMSFSSEKQAVLLIDEIDKANDRFLNDIHFALREKKFVIAETGMEIITKENPIVFITNNDSKDLPPSFTRLCYQYRMDFPSETILQDIAKAHFQTAPPESLEQTIKRFMNVRKRIPINGRPGVREFLDWLRIINMKPEQYEDVLKELEESYFASIGKEIETGLEQVAPLKIFLCHSSKDKTSIRLLYKRLASDGMKPWLDETDILPGQDWQQVIRKAVNESDVVLICLSSGVAERRGYIQKEIRFALDVADEQPEGSIFLIPLKLEECEVPERLTRWQWVNYFEENGYDKLLSALKYRRATLERTQDA
jgi:MoxR-like ATPase